MSFRLDWIGAGASLTLGLLVSVACRAPGEGYEDRADGGGATSTMGAAATTTPATTVTASSMGGAAAATSDGGSTVDGAAQTSGTATSDGGTTSDAGATSDSGTTTDGSAAGGATSTTATSTTGGGNGSSLIDNGDFSTSENPCVVDDSDWFTEGTLNWSGADEETCAYCIVLDAGQSGQLNWSGNSGTGPSLDPGGYRFALDVWSPEGEMIPLVSAKVGQPVDPYTGFLETDVTVGNSQATQSFTFNMDSADQVGIALFVSAPDGWGKVCFDNVVIEPQ